MTAGLADPQALAHADKKALVESVLPSPLAPSLTTLNVDTSAALALPTYKVVVITNTTTTTTTRVDLIAILIIIRMRERENIFGEWRSVVW